MNLIILLSMPLVLMIVVTIYAAVTYGKKGPKHTESKTA
jgi:hypothetical protein